MKEEQRVKSKILFNDIINHGKKASNKYFTIFFIDTNNNKKLFGVSAPKKNGNAVIRNKLKRQVRHIIHDLNFLFKNNRNYIIIIKKTCLEINFQMMKVSLQTLIGDINEK